MNKVALIIVDVQNDFVEGGALAVAGGKAIVPVINHIVQTLKDVLVVTTQDWHPDKTPHFDKWPVHCVAGTPGAALVADLELPAPRISIKKGKLDGEDGYSGFTGFWTHPIYKETSASLDQVLKDHGITHVYVCGIATDYCVKATVLDAVKNGYATSYIKNASVGVSPESTEAAENEMKQAGVQFISLY